MKITKNKLKQIIKEELQIMQEEADPVNLLTNLMASVEVELKMVFGALQNDNTSRAMSGIESALSDIDNVKGHLGLGSPPPFAPEPASPLARGETDDLQGA